MTDLDKVFKALRLVPDFDGNPHILTRFIKLCDQLVEEFGSESHINLLALLNGILNKVTGPAARLINSNGIPEDWNGIRKALINNFADQRDETALYNDLALLTQGSDSPQEFYEKCQSLFSTIMTYVSLHESVGTTVIAKRELYQKLTLQAYLRGLKDPLGSRIRCMRPESIEKALEFVHEETNILYMQNRNQQAPDRKPQQSSQPPRHPQEFLMPHKPITFNSPGPSRGLPMPQLGQYYRPPFGPYAQMNQAGPSRTQQMFGARPPNYSMQSNTFRLPARMAPQQTYAAAAPPPAPRPMSGVSHFSPRNLPPSGFNAGHDWRKFGNPPPSNYFKSREMNINECFEPAYDEYDYDQYYANYCDNYNDHDHYYDYDQPRYPEITHDSGDNTAYQGPTPTESEDFRKLPKSDKPK